MHSFYFSIHNLQTPVWVTLALALLTALWLLAIYRTRLASIRPTTSGSASENPAEWPGVSVIVLVQDNSQMLATMLPQVLKQDYPGKFEVIAVNDGANRDVTDVVKLLCNTYSNLRITFIPSEAHNLSRTKLGISLGIKAAKYPYIITTTSLVQIPSDAWLRLMTEPFARGKDISLGTARLAGLNGAMNRFDELEAQTIWLSGALAGHPYRGTTYNIGYKRQLFFDVKGFSKSLTLHYGEDDIFISEIATSHNAGVVIDPAANLIVNRYMPVKALRDLRMQHCFTSRFITRRSSMLFGFSTLSMWLWLAATIVGIILSLPNLLPTCFFAAIGIGLWTTLIIAWRNASNAQQIQISPWALPWLMFWRWTRTLRYTMACGSASRKNYTWTKR